MSILKKISKRILMILSVAVLVLIIAVFASRLVVRANTSVKDVNGMEQNIYLPVGKQFQALSIRGEGMSNPVVIYLHGGPASPSTPFDHVWMKYLTENYTFISWDQRGSGRTYYENEENDPLNESVNMAQLLEDLDDIVEWAKGRFFERKVIIMGHSWGTILGARYAELHPENVSAVIAVGQAVTSDGERISYMEARNRAMAEGDDTADMDEAYAKWERTGGDIMALQALRDETMEYLRAPEALSAFERLGLAVSSPYMGWRDIRWFFSQFDMEKFFSLNRSLFEEIASFDLRDEIKEIKVPMIFISGEEDWVTPVALVDEFREGLTVPYSVLETVPGCGHSPQLEAPERFAEAVLSNLRILKTLE